MQHTVFLTAGTSGPGSVSLRCLPACPFQRELRGGVHPGISWRTAFEILPGPAMALALFRVLWPQGLGIRFAGLASGFAWLLASRAVPVRVDRPPAKLPFVS